jgi:exocyst complex component 3
MGWIARYQEQLLALGVDESKAEILAECGAMDPLMNAYVDRMQDSMQVWVFQSPQPLSFAARFL